MLQHVVGLRPEQMAKEAVQAENRHTRLARESKKPTGNSAGNQPSTREEMDVWLFRASFHGFLPVQTRLRQLAICRSLCIPCS